MIHFSISHYLFSPLFLSSSHFPFTFSLSYSLLHDDVAARVGDDPKDLQDGHAASHQRCQGAGEPGQTDLVRDVAEDRQPDAPGIPPFTTLGGLDPHERAVDRRARRRIRPRRWFQRGIDHEDRPLNRQTGQRFLQAPWALLNHHSRHRGMHR